MGIFTGTQAEVLYAGPVIDYTAANAASTSAQSLIATGTGSFSQPSIPAQYIPIHAGVGKYFEGHIVGVLTGQASATTATFIIGLATAANNVSGTTLFTSSALTITSLSAVGWELDFKILVRTAGYGTTTVSTTTYTSGILSIGTTGLQGVGVPNSVTTIDASVTNWLYATVTFSTSSATNSAQIKQFILKGMN